MSENENVQSQTNSVQQLEDKVALLLNGTNLGGRTLAAALAKRGADIAIVYRQAHAKQAEKVKNSVEAEGQRCLIIRSQADKKGLLDAVVQQTIEGLGRLDIFIDYSSLPNDESPQDVNTDIVEDGHNAEQRGPFTNVEILSAALDQLANPIYSNNSPSKMKEREIKRSNQEMRVAQELINKPIITVKEGLEIGKVNDFYMDESLTHLVAIHLGSEGLFSRKETLIQWDEVVTLGKDAVLVKDSNCVREVDEVKESDSYIRRDDISNRPIDTPGGTKIGRIGDLVLDDEAKIAGFSLTQIQVSGPIATNRAISKAAVVDNGNEDGVMTANLTEAEQANLQVVYEGFFGEPSVTPARAEEASAEA